MRRHIAFFNFPAVGHVNPTVGMIEELAKRGHRVTCTVTEHFAPIMKAAGAEPVRYESVFGDFYRVPLTPEETAGEGLRSLNEAISLVAQVAPFYEENRPDVIVHDFMAWGARFFAAKNGIPLVRTYPVFGANEHFSIREKFPVAGPNDPQIVEAVRKLAGVLPQFGLPADPMGFLTHIEKLAVIFLPREFQYAGETFDERFVFTGPCIAERPYQGTWQPASPDRPVLLISLGTSARGWPEFFQMAIKAFGDSEWDVLITVGEHTDPADLGPLPANVDVRRYAPQLDVLRHARLFINHGGMNSTMESLNNGVPMVLVPQTNEQRANALRVEELGLGRLLAKEDVTVESLREVAARVTGDAPVAERVRAMRERMRSVDGPAVAADAVETYLAGLD
ncbi:macrolide family glycosyltransferase [Streptomyces brasiliensis]|uniref:UDP-glucosyltransferase YjiC n=1 Tax=Streptomyces brasiliensis TaxID=1954 RepID=A0A917NRZ6_9ACTN|nr:macrolide family glycosyltransferase [Streptomyces brasiliensis]GGJ22558.1 putative UDP-glucosyltransferase YjiC [Streptomyces brasiliensis]